MIGLLAGVAAYALAGFLIAPHAIRLWIESPNVSGPGCRLSVQDVYVNPFTMYLSLENATLFERESKLLVTASAVETTLWAVHRLQAGTPGRDVAFRNLVVTSADGDDALLTVPSVYASSVAVGGSVFLDADHARLERPEVAVHRNADGVRAPPAWLSVPGGDSAGTCISVGGFQAVGGTLRFTDDTVTPTVRLVLQDLEAGALRKPRNGTAVTDIDFEARVGEAGTVSARALLRQPAAGHPDLFSMRAHNVDLQSLSPYFRREFGRHIEGGFGNATLRQERDGATLRFDNRLSFDGLELGDLDEYAADDTQFLELALALVTDAADRGEFSIKGLVDDSQSQTVVGLFVDSLAAQLERLAARPFGVLAELAGDPDAALDGISFVPGSAEMAPAATDTLALLASALDMRPQLDLQVRPTYDRITDRDAIAAQQVRLHIALATSAAARESGDAAGPDYSDPRVRDVLDEFAVARLSAAQRRAIGRGTGDAATMYRRIYLALVANEGVSETVLRRLARFRARSLLDALERDGIDRDRLRITDALDATASGTETVALKVEVNARAAAQGLDTRSGETGSDQR